MPQFDLLLKGGEVIDPAEGVHARRDVGFAGGTVVAVAEDLPATDATTVRDVTGSLVVPGLVDLHTHFFYGITPIARDPRTELAPTGLTCAADAGTAGAENFVNLREMIIEPSPLRLYSWINIEALGMTARRYDGRRRFFLPDKAAAMARRNPGTIVGIKTQLPGPDDADADTAGDLLRAAAAGAADAGVPLMVHIDGGVALELLAETLRPGDVLTHCFQGHDPATAGSAGVHPAIRDAVDAGLVLDFAPAGRNHFSWRVAEAAAADGIFPTVISSDYATAPRGIPGFMRTLPEAMSMLLSLGMKLDDVVQAATATPANVLGKADRHGSLALGRAGDATVLRLTSAAEPFPDMDGTTRTLTEVLVPQLTVVDGAVLWESGN